MKVKMMIMAAMMIMMTSAADAQTEKKLTNFNDTTFTLNEVTVKSSLPKQRVKGDAMRTIVNGTILEKAGKATDVLNRIPQLKADKDGGVEVFGRGGAEVYINGRKVQDMKELTRISSEQIKSVDVVQNPGARYAASVKAVVRIQLKKAQGEGFSFRENLGTQYQYGPAISNNLDLNYRVGGLDITGSFWCGSYNSYKSYQKNDLTYYAGNDLYVGHSNQNMKNKWSAWSPQLQVNYMFDDNHSIGAFYKYDRHPKDSYDGWLHTDTYENGKFLERSESDIFKHTSSKRHVFNAYYNGKVGKLGIDFNIDGLFDDVNDPNGTTETTIDTEGNKTMRTVDNLTLSSNNFWATKLIFTYPVLKGNLSVGGEYSHNNRKDAYSYETTETLPMNATDNNIKETATSAFVEYGRQFGRVFAQVGLRYESICNDYYNFGIKEQDVSRSYGDWFPTAVVAMPIGKWQLSLSYRKDIKRPAYDQLTSSTLYINKYTYQTGNPYLKPTYTHNVVLNVAYKAFSLMIDYARTKDVVTLLTEPYPGSEDPLLSILHPKNCSDGYDKLVVMPSYKPTIGKWHPMWSAGLVMQNYKTLTANGTEKTMNHPFVQVQWNNDIELPKGFRVNAFMQYISKGDYDNFRMSTDAFNVSVGVQRDFNLKALGTLTADIRCNDIFNTNKTGTTVYGIRELTIENRARRVFSLDLTWKFNEARSKYKGTGAGKSQKARM